ncbi:C25 family cysteine peptidase [Fulvivirgaceae bacterium BMA10]|uniref:C25 family cysteine peptidase n=1 Tax=Splendidivirga corallicola TaxID=3051826 RepID=A0ABT8KR93_9BACT|nr:C25 family cysteine peptidase [Fulvivirgaceae bacterium BMA10]
MKGFRLLLLITLTAACFLRAQGQNDFGNEWIDFSQTYFKVSTAGDGAYRLTYNDLLSAGFPVSSVDPRRIQLFWRGVEQAIHIEGQENARLDPGDFIEFYGRRNDGTLDNELYIEPEAQPHTLYNLFSDTTSYFLTWKLSPSNGKRMNTFSENNVDGLAAEPYHLSKSLQLFTDQYSIGRNFPEGGNNSNTRLSQFDYGEGWMGTPITLGQFQNYTFDLSNAVKTGPKPTIEMVVFGANNRPHDVLIEVGSAVGSLRTLTNIQFNYYQSFSFSGELEWTDVGPAGELVVRVSVDPEGGADAIAMGFIKVNFAQSLDLAGETRKSINIEEDLLNKSYIEVANVPAEPFIYDITDINEIKKIGFNKVGSDLNAMVPAGSTNLFIQDATFPAPVIERIKFRQIDPSEHNYLIITHKKLRQSAGSVPDPIKAYAEYRASQAGGDFDTLSVTMDELYNQFSYGETTPLAIRRFAKFMLDGGDPQFLYLIGKAVDLDTRLIGSLDFYRNSPELFSVENLVPTAGVPGSDLAFTVGLNGTLHEPAIPTGRLNARSSTDVLNYLNKVKEMEALPYDALWRKNLVHLSGGRTVSELHLFDNFVDDFKEVAQDVYLGGKVETLNKTSNAAVELINIADEVNNGLALITFFGHSSGNFTDIEIGNVSNTLLGYDNQGKYPLIMVNGCNAGDIFNQSFTFGEDWLLAENKGALGFIAHSSTGFISQLKRYTDIFYSTAFGDSTFIDEPIGIVQLEVIQRFLATSTSEKNITQSQQAVLQGDPALKLFAVEKPDYAIKNENLFLESLDGGSVNALEEAFNLGIIVQNFGRVHDDSISISVQRILGDGTNITYDPMKFPKVLYQDTIFFRIPNTSAAFGNNIFEVTIDSNTTIEELNENNNVASLDFFIPLSSTSNVLPFNYAIVNSQPVKLFSKATDPLAAPRDFLFELDTTSSFQSPFMKSNTINARVLAEWTVDLLSTVPQNDSTVYYWRTRFAEPLAGEDTSWTVSSFMYIDNGSEGWSQSEPDQFDKASLKGIEQNEIDGKWKFQETEASLEVTTFGANSVDSSPTNIVVDVQGVPFIISSPSNRICRNDAMNAVAFDKATSQPYRVIGDGQVPDALDSRRCGRAPQVINNFINSEIQGGSLYIEQYIDAVNDGEFVLMFSLGNVTYQSWPASTISKMEEIGATATTIQALQDGEPYIILGRKGDAAGTAIEVIADPGGALPSLEQEINLNDIITGKFTSGTITSTRIGPAQSWDRFINLSRISEQPQTDAILFDLIGEDFDGNESLLFNDVSVSELNLSSIDAATYPYLRLKFETSDETNLTPAQLEEWLVLFEPTPEGILYIPSSEVSTINNQKGQEGQDFVANFIFKNISDKNFTDSLFVETELFNQNSRSTTELDLKLKPLQAEDSASFNININTAGKVGKNGLKVFVNPRIQPEQDYNNNIIDLPNYVEVLPDNANPLIDVAFDGAYIIDGDIVSPDPLITITVRDENQVLFKSDTVGMEILLKRPCVDCDPNSSGCETCDFERINFSNNNVQWFSATENSDYRIEFQLEDLEDGLYTLLVQATDASGNKSGTEPYKINFLVINESTITNFYPYPNPFSTSTRFVFTLTGSEVPEFIKIQIMTVTGRVVREITQNELGNIRIGNNISDFAWDGRDEYGDQLANGVYLYRVILGGAGANDFEHRETAADKAFKKGYGKIYLLK